MPGRLEFDANATVEGLRVGDFPNWMNENPATGVDRAALDPLRRLGLTRREVALPDWPSLRDEMLTIGNCAGRYSAFAFDAAHQRRPQRTP